MRKYKLSFQLVQVPDLLALLIKCEHFFFFKLLYTTMNLVFMLSHSLQVELSRLREIQKARLECRASEQDLMQVFQLRFNTFK